MFYQGSRALAAGELERAEQLFRAALSRGQGTVPYAHFMCTGAALASSSICAAARTIPSSTASSSARCWRCPTVGRLPRAARWPSSFYLRGEREAARREFEALAATGFDGIRRDEHWLVTVGVAE